MGHYCHVVGDYYDTVGVSFDVDGAVGNGETV
jgi:hypothetical protein